MSATPMDRMRQQIDHVVYLMLENRGFDHALGYLYHRKDTPANVIHDDPGTPFDGVPDPAPRLPRQASFYNNPKNYDGPWISPRPAKGGKCCFPTADPGEQYADVLQQLYGPPRLPELKERYQNLGFYLDWQDHRGEAKKKEIMVCNTARELPVLHGLARSFSVSDLYFSSVPTQTNPNRAFSLAGTSLGRVINEGPMGVGRPFNVKTTLFNAFEQKGVSWATFAPEPWYGAWLNGHPLQSYTRYMFTPLQQFPMDSPKFRPHHEFLARARAGDLPAFSYLEPTFIGNQLFTPVSSYHPPSSLAQGERFLLEIYDAVRSSPQWERTLLIVNFDEHGGTYDHVPTPNAIAPDTSRSYFTFTRYGVRVPLLLISPWIADGTVFRAQNSKLPLDHTSIIATLCDWQGIDCRDPAGDASRDFGARTAQAPGVAHALDDTLHDKPRASAFELPVCSSKQCTWNNSGAIWPEVRTGIERYIGTETAEALFRDFAETGITRADLARWLNILFNRSSRSDV